MRPSSYRPAALAAVTLGSGALMAAPFAIATWPRHAIPMKSWLSAGALGVLCTGIAFALFYRLIEKVGANRTAIVTYLVPPFGVAWGWLFLHEPVALTVTLACMLILGTVALSHNLRGKR